MAKFGVELSEDMVIELDVSPGAPALANVTLSFSVETEHEFFDAVERLGFRPEELKVTEAMQVRHSVPLTRDGERVCGATVYLWLKGDVAEMPEKPAIPAVERARRRMERRMGAPVLARSE